MKYLIILLSFVCVCKNLLAQNTNIDSLKILLANAKNDTNKVNIYSAISAYYNYNYPDTLLSYALKGLALSRQLNYKSGEIIILSYIGEALSSKGQYPKALEIKLNALQQAEELGDTYLVASCQNYLAALYIKTEDFSKALVIYNKAKSHKVYYWSHQKALLGMIGRCYYSLRNIDSAYYYARQAYKLDLKDTVHWTVPYYLMGAIYNEKGNTIQALSFYKEGNQLINIGPLNILNGYNGMAAVFKKMGKEDSALYYAKKVVKEGTERSLYYAVIEAGKMLAEIYKSGHAMDSAFKYQQIMLAAKDSLFSKENITLIQNLTFNEQQRQQQLEQARKEARQEYKTKIKLYSLLSGLIVLLLIAFILYRNNRHKQKAYELLKKQKLEIDNQKVTIEQTLNNLKSTQAQLIQSEKMASLGELTAGIAHEIQNPLNFVNNFSEVNDELISELVDEVDKGNTEEVKIIANDIKQNLEKINHHGKRADAIVKNMMQHSRQTKGVKEPTDINALCDEYLRLAYHGLRAKDKNFNADFKTDFDESISKINIVPQDIGRVLLNLFNNAFYAVNEKQKDHSSKPAAEYKPLVSVATKRINDKIEIVVSDNGKGIPQNIIDKIFQPFFTTKPTGQGTGLGLSLAYDIITKEHNGSIKVESKEGEGSVFIIQLPITCS